MDPALRIGRLWLAFAATHIGLSSSRLRARLVESLGSTPFLPFTASQTLVGPRELSPFVVAAAIALAIVLRYFHRPLFGP